MRRYACELDGSLSVVFVNRVVNRLKEIFGYQKRKDYRLNVCKVVIDPPARQK